MIQLLKYQAWAISEGYFRLMLPEVVNAIRTGTNLIEKKTLEDFKPTISGLLAVADEEGHPAVELAAGLSMGFDPVSTGTSTRASSVITQS